jgi:hypothetical protein
VVVVQIAVVLRAERAQEHEAALEGIGHEHPDDSLARTGERLGGRGGRQQLILARHGA